jgi:hypothetical protein
MSIDLLPDSQPEATEGSVSHHRTVEPADPAHALQWPETAVSPVKVRWRYAIGIPVIHLLACLALFFICLFCMNSSYLIRAFAFKPLKVEPTVVNAFLHGTCTESYKCQ